MAGQAAPGKGQGERLGAEGFDVVVAGGGAAGIGAAVGAAQAGARTLLVERYGFLGGAATNANVLTYCGLYQAGETPRRAVAGVAEAMLAGLKTLGGDITPRRGQTGNWIVLFDPEALKRAADRVVIAAGVETWLHARLTGAVRRDGVLEAVRVTDHAGTHEIAARAFVDASGEADLGVLAGLPIAFPRPGLDGVQPGSAPFRLGGLPPGAMPDRACLARVAAAANRLLPSPCIRPEGGIFIPMPGAGEAWWMCIDLNTDGLSAPDLTRAEQRGREAAWACIEALRREPGMEGAHLLSTGPQFGIRETRRCATRQMVTGEQVVAGARSPDGVARGAWPMEVHEAPGRVALTPVGAEGFFDIPLPALRAAGIDNLWCAGRVIGADRAAFGSVRVMGTALATGHAAGVAAALRAGGVGEVQAELRRQGALV